MQNVLPGKLLFLKIKKNIESNTDLQHTPQTLKAKWHLIWNHKLSGLIFTPCQIHQRLW